MEKIFHKIKIVIGMLCIISIISLPVLYLPSRAEAAPGLGVPNDTSFDFNSIMAHMKDFVLDKLAVSIANQILQRMTASVVTWINTGFQGSPAFLTNPEGFFLDAADQVTGEFLSKEGALSRLCTPFSLDIRLNIALSQGTYYSQRYTCTLGKILNNTSNAIATAGQNSGLDVRSDPNGATIGNFINGDFKQGGWAGFIAYSTQPQNNPIGAELMARSDLQALIAQKHSAINTDLNRGNGFLSWESCKDVPPGEVAETMDDLGLNNASFNGAYTLGSKKINTGNGTSYKAKVDANGNLTYQDCHTETPGSVISGTLQRQLNVPTDKLVLVKTISDSIDAILGALTNQMLTQGLAALSSHTSGKVGGRSYLSDLYVESVDSPNSNVGLSDNYLVTYDKTIASVNQSRAAYQSAQACFQAKLNTLTAQQQNQFNSQSQKITYAQGKIATIDSKIKTVLDPLISRLNLTRQSGQAQMETFKTSVGSASSFSDLNSVVDNSSKAVQSGIDVSSTAQSEVADIQKQIDGFNEEAAKYQDQCNRFMNGPDVDSTWTGIH